LESLSLFLSISDRTICWGFKCLILLSGSSSRMLKKNKKIVNL